MFAADPPEAIQVTLTVCLVQACDVDEESFLGHRTLRDYRVKQRARVGEYPDVHVSREEYAEGIR